MRDLLSPDRGNGRLSRTAEREFKQLRDPSHPRQCCSPSVELEIADEKVALAADRERDMMHDRSTQPKPPQMAEEATTDRTGSRTVDVQRDSPLVDDLATFDLSTDDLLEGDL